MIESLKTALRRTRQAAEARWKEIQYDRAYRERCANNMSWVGALVIVSLAAPACVPRHVDRGITAEHRRCSDAIDAAALVSVAAYDAALADCHARIERLQP